MSRVASQTAPPFAAGSQTSQDAADSVAGSASSLRAQVFGLLQAEGKNGLTDEELQDLLGIGGNTERPRRRELVQVGAVVDSGCTRKTRSGREATVWTINPALLAPKGQLDLELFSRPDPDDMPW